jgi:hypothetical protein
LSWLGCQAFGRFRAQKFSLKARQFQIAERSDCLFPLPVFFAVKVPQPRAIWEVLAVVECANRDFAGDGLIDAAEPVAAFGG